MHICFLTAGCLRCHSSVARFLHRPLAKHYAGTQWLKVEESLPSGILRFNRLHSSAIYFSSSLTNTHHYHIWQQSSRVETAGLNSCIKGETFSFSNLGEEYSHYARNAWHHDIESRKWHHSTLRVCCSPASCFLTGHINVTSSSSLLSKP